MTTILAVIALCAAALLYVLWPLMHPPARRGGAGSPLEDLEAAPRER